MGMRGSDAMKKSYRGRMILRLSITWLYQVINSRDFLKKSVINCAPNYRTSLFD